MRKNGKMVVSGWLAAVLLPLAWSAAPDGLIRGRVLQAPGRTPLPGVLITIHPARPDARSADDGSFSIPSLPPGRYTLRFQKAGSASREIRLEVRAGEIVEIEPVLEPTRLGLHEEITVTAERDPRAAFQSPAAVSTLTAGDLGGRWPRTLPELLPEAPGVWLQKTNHGGGSPFLRGLTGNQVLALVDGVRLNNSTYRYGPNQYVNTVDPFSVDRVEIVRGSGATLYGSDAVGGVLNLLTAPPPLTARGTEFSPTLAAKLAGGGQEKTGRLGFRLGTPRLGLAGGVSLRSFGDLRAGGDLGVESPSGYDETAADLKGLFRLGDSTLLTAAWQYVRQPEVPAYDQVAQRGYSRYVFSPQERRLGYLRLVSYTACPLWREVEATVSWQESLEGREKRPAGGDRLARESDRVSTLGFQVQARSEPRPWWRLTSGCELYSDLVRSEAEDIDLATGSRLARRGLYPDGARAFNLAVYHAQALDAGRFGLRAGLRYNYVSVRARDPVFGDTDVSPSALVGHFSLLYRLGGRLHAVLNFNRSFRAPNVNDLSTFGAFDYGIEVPAPGLRPEFGTTLEAGLKSRGGRWAWAGYLYRTWLNDLILRVESTYRGSPFYEGDRVYQKANAQRAYIQGLEAEAQGQLGRRWRTVMSLTATFGQNIDAKEPLRRIPPLNGRIRLEHYPRADIELAGEWLFADRQSRLSAGDIADHRIPLGGTPGWQVVNFQALWRLGRFVLIAGLDNLFDEAYRTHGSGIDAPGRGVWTGLRWGW